MLPRATSKVPSADGNVKDYDTSPYAYLRYIGFFVNLHSSFLQRFRYSDFATEPCVFRIVVDTRLYAMSDVTGV